MGIGLPQLAIEFRAAAREINNRSKQGVVGLVVRDDAQAVQGLHTLYSAQDMPKGLGTENVDYISEAFTGGELGTPSKVLLAVVGKEAGENDHLGGGLELLAVHSIDYLAGPADLTTAEADKIKNWTGEQRKLYRTVKAVLPETEGDSMGVVNVVMGDTVAGGKPRTSAAMCARVAGILAGIPQSCSATSTALPEVTRVKTFPDPDGEVDKGHLILVHDGMKAKIGRAVNSLVTVPVNGKEDWKKIKIVEGMDLISYFLRTSVEDKWRGRYANSYDNQCLLLVAIRDFFTELEGSVIQAGSGWAEINVAAKRNWLRGHGVEVGVLTDQQVKEYDSGSRVFIRFGCTIIDAAEDFDFVGEL